MKHTFELFESRRSDGASTIRTRRHPYHTQTELHVLLRQLQQFEQLASDHDDLLDMVALAHEPEHQVVVSSYVLPSYGGMLDIPGDSPRREVELGMMMFQLTHTLHRIHEQGLVHGDIRPNTVWVAGERGAEVFSLYAPSLLTVDATQWDSPGWHDHLVRRAPEWLIGQKKNDERTDLYALGVLIFEQLAPLPEVHVLMDNLAYYSLQSEVFEQLPHLGSILAALLDPDQAQRYQTSEAVLEELESRLKNLVDNGQALELTQRSMSGTLHVPDVLIGHQDLCEEAQRSVRDGTHKVLIVEGAEGTGKTTFLHALSSALASDHMTLLVQCKMTHRALPMQLLEELAKQLLYWPHHQVKAMQAILSTHDQHTLMQCCDLLRSLFGGDRSHVMTAETSHNAQQSEQLGIAIHALLHAVLRTHDRAVMWCIDDLDAQQTTHFEFLTRLLSDRSEAMQRLTLVFSVRDTSSLSALDLDTSQHVFALEPLTPAQTSALILATLGYHHQPFASTLTQYIHPITQGVPLLILHILFMLHATDVIAYERREGEHVWTLDEEALARVEISDALAQIVSQRLDLLGEDALQLLKLVALCKPAALMPVLDEAHDGSASARQLNLDDACRKGLLVQTSAGQYQFMHALIERAITARITHDEAVTMHERLLSTTHQLLEQPPYSADPHERHQLRSQRAHHAAQLGLLGGKRDDLHDLLMDGWRSAIERADSSARIKLSSHIVEHHFARLWSGDAQEALELTTSHTSDLFRSGQAGNAMALLERAIELASLHAMDKRLGLIVTRVELLTLNAFYEQALLVGLAELSLLGITQLTRGDVDALKASCTVLLDGRAPMELLHAPRSQDTRHIQTTALLAAMLPLTYISAPERFHAVVYKLVEFNLQHAHTPSASRGYSCYGQLMALEGRVHEALDFGNLAMSLADHFGDLRAHAIACSDMANYIAHWTRPLESMHELNMQSHQEAMQAGELQYAGYALMHDCYNRFFAQEYLSTLHKDAKWALARCFQLGNQLAIRVIEGLLILLEDFLLDAPARTREDDYIASCVGEENRMAMALFAIGRSMVCYAHQDHVGAQSHFNRAIDAAGFIEGWFPLNELSAISQLTLSEQHLEMTRDLHHKIPVPATPDVKLIGLRELARNSPENFQHRWLWLQSMHTRELDQWGRLELIEKAFEAAVAQERFFDAAVIRLHASNFWQRANRVWLAHTCRAESQSLWLKWGAVGLISSSLDGKDHAHTSTLRTPLIQYQAEHAIAETMNTLEHLEDPGELIEHAMRTLINVAGSVRGAALMLDTDHEHVSQGAIYDQITHTHTLLSHRDLDALAHELPLHLVRTVLHGDALLSIPDVRTHQLTRHDASLRTQGILTLYIMRVPLHLDLQLLIYLEHNQFAGVFTPEREHLIKAQIPLLCLALEALEHSRLSAHHTSPGHRDPRLYRKDVIALFEDFLSQIHTSTMLIEHGAASISPAIQADLNYISHTSSQGIALLHLLGAIEEHELHRVQHTCCITELVTQLNTAHGYAFTAPHQRCDIKVNPSLFLNVIRSLLLWVVPPSHDPRLEFTTLEDVLELRCSPVDEALHQNMVAHFNHASVSSPHKKFIVAEIFSRGLRALHIHLRPEDQRADELVLRWTYVT